MNLSRGVADRRFTLICNPKQLSQRGLATKCQHFFVLSFCIAYELVYDVLFFAWFVREHVLKLEAVARKDYYGDDPDASPYCTAPK